MDRIMEESRSRWPTVSHPTGRLLDRRSRTATHQDRKDQDRKDRTPERTRRQGRTDRTSDRVPDGSVPEPARINPT